jgi:truncated hemoglobin YjbI
MTNEECDDELREILWSRLREIERKMDNMERIGRMHTDSWMKLMKQKLGIIRKLNNKK